MSRSYRRTLTRATQLAWRALSLSASVAACAPRSAHVAKPASSACAPTTASSPALDSISVVITSGIEPPTRTAGVATTDGERFVHAQLYETLVALDCTGAVQPGLASSWRSDGGRRQIVRVRDDARFWGGAPVTATDVIGAWRTSTIAARFLADSTTVLDERTLAIPLPESELRTLADPAFALRRPVGDAPWPEGTGAYRVASSGNVRNGALELVPVAADGTRPRVVVTTANARDARDRLDAGADLVLTRDADVLGYAAARADVQSIPLPWDRTYVLLSPHELSISPATTPSADSARAALARDVVRADARAAEGPYWWRSISSCAQRAIEHSVPSRAFRSSVVYRADDRVASQLAERLVALAEMTRSTSNAGAVDLTRDLLSSTPPAIAQGLQPAAFDSMFARPAVPLAYVIDIPSHAIAPCAYVNQLLARAPWWSSSESDGLAGLVPLVETRAHAIVRGNRVSFVIDGMGVPHITGSASQ